MKVHVVVTSNVSDENSLNELRQTLDSVIKRFGTSIKLETLDVGTLNDKQIGFGKVVKYTRADGSNDLTETQTLLFHSKPIDADFLVKISSGFKFTSSFDLLKTETIGYAKGFKECFVVRKSASAEWISFLQSTYSEMFRDKNATIQSCMAKFLGAIEPLKELGVYGYPEGEFDRF